MDCGDGRQVTLVLCGVCHYRVVNSRSLVTDPHPEWQSGAAGRRPIPAPAAPVQGAPRLRVRAGPAPAARTMDRSLRNVLVVSLGFLLLFTAYGGLQSLQVRAPATRRLGPQGSRGHGPGGGGPSHWATRPQPCRAAVAGHAVPGAGSGPARQLAQRGVCLALGPGARAGQGWPGRPCLRLGERVWGRNTGGPVALRRSWEGWERLRPHQAVQIPGCFTQNRKRGSPASACPCGLAPPTQVSPPEGWGTCARSGCAGPAQAAAPHSSPCRLSRAGTREALGAFILPGCALWPRGRRARKCFQSFC